MAKNANSNTRLDVEPKHEKPPERASQTGPSEHDARQSEATLRENQRELGVGKDHKTEDMEESGRGTFP